MGSVAGGCGGEEEARRTPQIENFVTPKRDPGFKAVEVWEAGPGFGATQPDRGWTVAAKDGRVTLESPGEKCTAWAEAVPGELGDPKAHGEALLVAWCGDTVGCAVAEEGFALYNGKTAWRWEARKETGPGQVEMVRTSVLLSPTDGGGAWRITVQATGTGREYAARRRCLDLATAGVSVGLPEAPAPLVVKVDEPTEEPSEMVDVEMKGPASRGGETGPSGDAAP